MSKSRRNSEMNRRKFFVAAGATTLASLGMREARPETTGEDEKYMQTETLTGNGEWTYRVMVGWENFPREPSSAARMELSLRTTRAAST